MDVRDTARAHRLCAESTTIPNGSRYCLVASDRSGELFTHELQAKLLKLYPDVDVRAAPAPATLHLCLCLCTALLSEYRACPTATSTPRARADVRSRSRP